MIIKNYIEANKPYLKIPRLLWCSLFKKNRLGRNVQHLFMTLIAFWHGESYKQSKKNKKEETAYCPNDDSFKIREDYISYLSATSRGRMQKSMKVLVNFGFVKKFSGRNRRQANRYILYIPDDLINIYSNKKKVDEWYEKKLKEIKRKESEKAITHGHTKKQTKKKQRIDSNSTPEGLLPQTHKESLAHLEGEQLTIFDGLREDNTRCAHNKDLVNKRRSEGRR